VSKAAQVSAQLVSLVNPRLAMYTRAGFLAAIILAINFAIVGCLALYMARDCTESSIIERSSPVTFGDFLTYEEFINTTLDREGVVKEDETTTTITVSGCVKRNSAVLVAPYMASLLCADTCMREGNRTHADGVCDEGVEDEESGGQMTDNHQCPRGTDCTDCGTREPPPSSYSGTGITTDVPCWNQYVPCIIKSTSPPPSTASPPPSSPTSSLSISTSRRLLFFWGGGASPSPPPSPSQLPPPPLPSSGGVSNCTDQLNSGLMFTDGTPVPCTYFTTTPTQCADYPLAMNNCPISCGSCQGICMDACRWNDDGECDDGGPGFEHNFCSPGTDCTDCGPRALNPNGVQAVPPPPPSSYTYSSSYSSSFFGPNGYNYNYGDGGGEPNSSGGAAGGGIRAPTCGWYKTPEAEQLGGPSYRSMMGPKADRFPWCSEEVYDIARRKYAKFHNLTSTLDQSSINLAITCGMNKMNNVPVSPAGVQKPNLSPAPGEKDMKDQLRGTMTSFTTHWSLNVTTNRTVCPKFSVVFGTALSYSANIELIITIVLVFVFKMCALIEDEKGVIDLSKGVIRHATLKQVAVSPE
jgi:hypothetical protein